jgi:hypothetical protein
MELSAAHQADVVGLKAADVISLANDRAQQTSIR